MTFVGYNPGYSNHSPSALVITTTYPTHSQARSKPPPDSDPDPNPCSSWDHLPSTLLFYLFIHLPSTRLISHSPSTLLTTHFPDVPNGLLRVSRMRSFSRGLTGLRAAPQVPTEPFLVLPGRQYGCGSKLNGRGKPQVLVHVSTYQG